MIAVVDYGMGNLHSVRHAFLAIGAEVVVTDKPADIERAERIVLPGVGAFGECMKNLSARGIIPVLEEQVLRKRKPFLGICLGMQILATAGEEMGTHRGLGWIEGTVRRLDVDARGLRVPHVGWNEGRVVRPHPVFADIGTDATFYYVHSYVFDVADRANAAMVCDYGGEFTAAIAKDNIVATQFHPEKSQRDGFALLERFVRWTP